MSANPVSPASKPMLPVALEAIDQGFAALPVREGDKKPALIKDWPARASTDEAAIRALWAEYPFANVAVHCAEHAGRHLVVVDVDATKGGGETWQALGGQFIKTRKHKTPSGGLHAFFYAPQPMGNTVEKLGKGVDTRGVHGYVLWPGSRTALGKYTVHTDAPIAELPPAWFEKLGAARPKVERDANATPIQTDEDAAVARAKDWLRDQPPAVEGQGGDFYTFKVCCMVRDFGVPENRAMEALSEFDARCVPPWGEALETKIANAWRYAENAPGSRTPEALGFEAIEEAKPSEQAKGSIVDVLPGSDAARTRAEAQAAIDSAAEKREDVILQTADATATPQVWTDNYIIKGWLWSGIDAQIFGHTNTGKTFLSLHLGVHVAAGAPWFSQRVKQGGVLYLPYEGVMALPRRLAALRTRYPDLPWGSMPFAWLGMNAPLVADRVQDQDALPGRKRLQAAVLKFAEKYGAPPALAIVDTYSRAIGGSASDEALAGKFASMARALAETYGTTMLRVHHPGHADSQRARGSYAIGAGLDVDIRVSEGLIEAPKQRDAEKNRLGFRLEVVQLGVDQDGDPITSCAVAPAEIPADRGLSGPQKQLMGVIRAAADGEGVAARRSVREAARATGAIAEGDPGRKRLQTLLEQLKKKERIDFDDEEVRLLERGSAAIFDEE